MTDDSESGDGPVTESPSMMSDTFEIIIIIFLLFSYILIGFLFVLLFFQKRKRQYKLFKRKKALSPAQCSAVVMAGSSNSGEDNTPDNTVVTQHTSNTQTASIAYNTVTDQLIGLPPNLANPNYMSNFSGLGAGLKPTPPVDRVSKRFSNVSELRRYSQNPVVPITEEHLPRITMETETVPEDNYSLIAGSDNEGSEHNYSVISTEEIPPIGRLSMNYDNEDSEHNYSCISHNSSRFPSINSLSKGRDWQQEEEEEEEHRLPVADYEEFYSIAANPDSNISESEEETSCHDDNKLNTPQHGSFETTKQFRRSASPLFISSRPPRPLRNKERSATDIDTIIQQQSTADNTITVTVRHKEAIVKPTPKPRVIRKVIESDK